MNDPPPPIAEAMRAADVVLDMVLYVDAHICQRYS